MSTFPTVTNVMYPARVKSRMYASHPKTDRDVLSGRYSMDAAPKGSYTVLFPRLIRLLRRVKDVGQVSTVSQGVLRSLRLELQLGDDGV